MKKLITGAAAAAMLGGLLLAPSSFADSEADPADDKAATGHCSEGSLSGANDNGVVDIYSEAPGEGQGCLVLEGGGEVVPVHPLDDGHIGVYEKEDGTAGLYGSCTTRGEDEHFSTFDPTAESETDPAETCDPNNDDTPES